MIPLCVPEISGNEWKYIKECLDTNWVSSVGSYVDLFENKFKEYVKSKVAVATMNGTAALTLALQMLGIGYKDEVIVPSMTFIASINCVKYVSANPVFVDITPDTWVMDVEKIEDLITERTKAILPVHLYGNVVDMEPLMKIAKKYNLYVIEDATEALGAEYQTSDGIWHKAGTIGHIGAFSFNGNKLITTGAGGMLVTNNEEWGKRAKYLCNQAKSISHNGGFYHEEIGYNYRMPNVLAAMGVAQLERIDEYIQNKKKNAAKYDINLKHIKGLQLAKKQKNVKHVQWLYSILVNNEYFLSRDEVIEFLNKKGVQSRPFFYPIDMMKPYIACKRENLDTTYEIAKQGLNLPSSVSLNADDIEYITKILVKKG